MILAGPRKLTGSAALPVEASSIASGENDAVVISVTGAVAGDTVSLNIPAPAFGTPILAYYFTGTNTVTVCFKCPVEDAELYWPAATNITATIQR